MNKTRVLWVNGKPYYAGGTLKLPHERRVPMIGERSPEFVMPASMRPTVFGGAPACIVDAVADAVVKRVDDEIMGTRGFMEEHNADIKRVWVDEKLVYTKDEGGDEANQCARSVGTEQDLRHASLGREGNGTPLLVAADGERLSDAADHQAASPPHDRE